MYHKSFIQNTLGYTEEQLESIRNAVAEQMMFDLRDSVQQGRNLDVNDNTGATAVSTLKPQFTLGCLIEGGLNNIGGSEFSLQPNEW